MDLCDLCTEYGTEHILYIHTCLPVVACVLSMTPSIFYIYTLIDHLCEAGDLEFLVSTLSNWLILETDGASGLENVVVAAAVRSNDCSNG